MFDALAEIDARAYIIDCVPNCAALTCQEFEERLRYGIDRLRKAGKAPIIFAENQFIDHPSALVHSAGYRGQMEKDSVQQRVVKELQAKGVEGLYYVTRADLGFDADDFIEGVHLNDIGMLKYEEMTKTTFSLRLRLLLLLLLPPFYASAQEWTTRVGEVREEQATTSRIGRNHAEEGLSDEELAASGRGDRKSVV